jgi:hypothetical protein
MIGQFPAYRDVKVGYIRLMSISELIGWWLELPHGEDEEVYAANVKDLYASEVALTQEEWKVRNSYKQSKLAKPQMTQELAHIYAKLAFEKMISDFNRDGLPELPVFDTTIFGNWHPFIVRRLLTNVTYVHAMFTPKNRTRYFETRDKRLVSNTFRAILSMTENARLYGASDSNGIHTAVIVSRRVSYHLRDLTTHDLVAAVVLVCGIEVHVSEPDETGVERTEQVLMSMHTFMPWLRHLTDVSPDGGDEQTHALREYTEDARARDMESNYTTEQGPSFNFVRNRKLTQYSEHSLIANFMLQAKQQLELM